MSVHLGMKGGRMGLWTAPPGVDASGETGKMTLNSDYDHLQIHDFGVWTESGVNQGNGTWLYAARTISFVDLGYIPFVFISNSVSTDKGITYPPRYSNDYAGGDLQSISIGGAQVYTDHFFMAARFGFYPTERTAWIVFKNRAW
jgi:hypothetical protein